jgi:hypothetical protein
MTATGGYRVDWAAGIAGCANQVGAAISILVDGRVIPAGVNVGDGGGSPLTVFNINVNDAAG